MISKIELYELKDHLAATYDLFVCCSSFESRCLSAATNLGTTLIRNHMILHYSDHLQYVSANKEKLESLFNSNCISVQISLVNPLVTADNMLLNLSKISANCQLHSVLIDITTFTHESLLILLRLFKNYFSQTQITYVYSGAESYSIGDEDTDCKWLSKGIGELRSILGYAGNIVPSWKTHLILIVGYETERAMSIINSLEPNSLSLGYGLPDNATTAKNKEANAHYMSIVKQMASSYENITDFNILCDDPFATCLELEKQIALIHDANIIVVPMNNKISTIGVAMAAFKNESIQVCYAPALNYNFQNYSTPGTQCYIFNLNEN